MALFNFLWPIIFLALIIIAPYYIILGGLKFLQIRGIPRSKVFVFYLSIMIIAFLTERFFNPFLVYILKITSSRILYGVINNSIYLVVNFILLKYYFQLSGKKLWYLFLYFIVVGLIFSALISLPAILSF